MKILILSQFFQPEPIAKGLPLAIALRNMGHDVEVLTGFPNYPLGKLYPNYKIKPYDIEFMDGIKVIRTALYPNHDLSGFKRLLNYASFAITSAFFGLFLIDKPDVIYIYNLVTIGITAKILRFFKHCPFVIDVQDLWPESVESSGMLKSNTLNNILRTICNRIYKNANHLIVLSPGFKNILIERGINENKIDVIYNWCDEDKINVIEKNLATAEKYGFKDHFNIVYSGNLGIVQSLDTILEAAKILQEKSYNILITFVGSGIEKQNLIDKAENMNLKNVQFIPQKPLTEIGEIYSIADVLLLHLKNDPIFEITIPSKLQAYLYSGKPILAAIQGDAANLVAQSNSGLVCKPEDADELAKTMIQMSEMSEDDLKNMGNNGYNYYMNNLSYSSGTKQIAKVLQDVAKV